MLAERFVGPQIEVFDDVPQRRRRRRKNPWRLLADAGPWQQGCREGTFRNRLAFAHAELLRALVRADEIWLALLATVVGIFGGFGVVLINSVTFLMHTVLFPLAPGQGLSESRASTRCALWWCRPGRAAAGAFHGSAGAAAAAQPGRPDRGQRALWRAHVAAGFADRCGADGLVQRRWRLGRHGGGLCPARFGHRLMGRADFRLRRNDLRVLVGCGAAAAIGGAFNAPLCGAFYGFELVVGVYSIATLPFVVVCGACGHPSCRSGRRHRPSSVAVAPHVPPDDYGIPLIAGVACGIAGIVIMRGVTFIEAAFRRSPTHLVPPAAWRPAVGLLGFLTPTVLSSGHSALHASNGRYRLFIVLGMMLVEGHGFGVLHRLGVSRRSVLRFAVSG